MSPDASLFLLFRQEVESHLTTLQNLIIKIESQVIELKDIENMMRSAHSMKGAFGIFGLQSLSHVAHAMEDYFIQLQKNEITQNSTQIDILLTAVDFLSQITTLNEEDLKNWQSDHLDEAKKIEEKIKEIPVSEILKTKEVSKKQKKDPIIKLFQEQAKTQLENALRTFKKIKIDSIVEATILNQFTESFQSIIALAQVVNAKEVEELAQILINLANHKNDKNPIDSVFHQTVQQKLIEIESCITKCGEARKENKEELEKIGFFSGRSAEVQKPTKPINTETSAKQEVLETDKDSFLRISSKSLNKIMALSAESLMETQRLNNFRGRLLRIKQVQNRLSTLSNSFSNTTIRSLPTQETLDAFQQSLNVSINHFRKLVQDQIEDYDTLIKEYNSRNTLLYHEILKSRMRPFGDRIQGFPRLVRDLARILNKRINLEIIGLETPVDREILDKLEAPINHMLRNACDHGIEMPEERILSGKTECAKIQIEARHSSGMLLIEVRDDGAGINIEKIRQIIVKKGLLNEEMANHISEAEILEFLFLPGFSSATNVTEISGRGVGLDVVQALMQEVGGSVKIKTELHKGTTFFMRLPITRSVIKALLVDIDSEIYAFPLNRLEGTVKLPADDISIMENHQYFHWNNQNIGIVSAREVLGLSNSLKNSTELSILIFDKENNYYGVIVDHLLGEMDLIIRPLDKRLGKIPCISSAAITNEGNPILIIEIDDLIQNIDKLLCGGKLGKPVKNKTNEVSNTKRILVVDDSITVRETEKQLLERAGYHVEMAVDGIDAWNILRQNNFDLVVTDVDMPRMNGYEFISLVRNDSHYKNIPIIIVSYKDRYEDRLMGQKTGVNLYLTKSSFQDDSFLLAIQDFLK